MWWKKDELEVCPRILPGGQGLIRVGDNKCSKHASTPEHNDIQPWVEIIIRLSYHL
jgi:hypothetical protein